MKSAAPAFNKRAQRKRLRRSAGPGVMQRNAPRVTIDFGLFDSFI